MYIYSICSIHICIHLHIMSFNAGFLPRQPCEKLPKPIGGLPPHSAEVRKGKSTDGHIAHMSIMFLFMVGTLYKAP